MLKIVSARAHVLVHVHIYGKIRTLRRVSFCSVSSVMYDMPALMLVILSCACVCLSSPARLLMRLRPEQTEGNFAGT